MEGFRQALPRDPLLVVPTTGDAERAERELSEGGGSGARDGSEAGAVVGGAVTTFTGLFSDVAHALDQPWSRGASHAQRTWLARRAIDAADIPLLRRSARHRGFAFALAQLIDELETDGVDPSDFAARVDTAEDAGAYERELAALYEAYVGHRAEHRSGDRHEQARNLTAALKRGASSGASAAAWGGRPVFIYGFDDLNPEQLELVLALAAVTQVTIAVVYDESRPALAARTGLLVALRDQVPPGELTEIELQDANDPDHTPLLGHLDRNFLVAGAPAAEPDRGLSMMHAAGERAEVEQVGGEVARLLAEGVAPTEITVVLRNPDASGALWAEVFGGLGIPVAVEAEAPLSATATGRALAAAARLASDDGTAADLLAYLRVPGRGAPSKVDRLERAVRRQGLRAAADAEAAWSEIEGRELLEIAALRAARTGAELMDAAAFLARDIAEFPLKRSARLDHRLELRAAAAVDAALHEISELDPDGAGPGELAALLDGISVPLHRGATRGRVQIVSPYRLTAFRVTHLFVASLQAGVFPRRDAGSPLLSDDRRARLALPRRADAEDEERYLFSACLSRPTQELALSWCDTTDEGLAAPVSSFVDDIRDLLAPERPPDPEASDPVMAAIARGRGPSEVVASVQTASSPRELARALALAGRDHWRAGLDAAEVSDDASRAIAAALEEATAATAPERLRPRDLRSPAVLAALKANDLYGPSTLEQYAECSYRWFVRHELKPERLEPTDEPLLLGGLAHRALQLIYGERPGGTPRPTPKTLRAWQARAEELIEENAPKFDLPETDPMALAQIRRVQGLLSIYLREEAASEPVLEPDPDLLEAKFGEGPESARGPLELDGVRLHGSIDRVDVGTVDGVRVGLIRDYKLSKKVASAAQLEKDGKLQLQLYSLALQNLWGIRAVGGVYLPLRGSSQKERRPRGIMDKRLSAALAGIEIYPNDVRDEDPEEGYEAMLDRAAARASEIAGRISSGRVRRDPPEGECPRWCRFQPICRKERGVAEDLDEDESYEAAE